MKVRKVDLVDLNEYMPLPELETLTGLSRATLCRRCASGKVPAIREGLRWYVPRAQVPQLMRDGVFALALTGRKRGKALAPREVRTCKYPPCGKTFTVTPSSTRAFHSRACWTAYRCGDSDISITEAAKLLGISKQAASLRHARKPLKRADIEAELKARKS